MCCVCVQVLVTQLEAKKLGYSDVVYLDAKTDTYLEEVSSCNIFCVKGKRITTPPLQGTILPGVTRRCACDCAAAAAWWGLERLFSTTGVTQHRRLTWRLKLLPVQPAPSSR